LAVKFDNIVNSHEKTPYVKSVFKRGTH
jgi:hypothetical protein